MKRQKLLNLSRHIETKKLNMTHNSKERQDEIILDVLCCVMVVDKTASAAEKAHVHTILSEDGSNWTTDEVNERIMKFIAQVEDQGFWSTLDDVCDKASALPASRVEKLVQNCITLAKSDSEFHERERKAIGRILKRLPQLQLNGTASQKASSSPTGDMNIPKARSKQISGRQSPVPVFIAKLRAKFATLSAGVKVGVCVFGSLVSLIVSYIVYCESIYFLWGQSATGKVTHTEKYTVKTQTPGRNGTSNTHTSILLRVKYTFKESNGTVHRDSASIPAGLDSAGVHRGTKIDVQYVPGSPGWSRTRFDSYMRWRRRAVWIAAIVGVIVAVIKCLDHFDVFNLHSLGRKKNIRR